METQKPILIPLSRIEQLDLGISHLKDSPHQDVYSPWNKLEDLVQDYNDLVDSLDEELTQTIRKKMHENLPIFTDWNSDTTSAVTTNFYYSGQINRFITEYVLSSLAEGYQPTFENVLEKGKQKQYPEQEESLYPWVVTPREWLNNYLFQSITEIELERVGSILRPIISEGEIMKKIRRMFEIEYMEIRQSKKAFEESIEKLTKKIDDRHDDFLIKGKCEKCKEWNK
jgi:hypothetical protein